MFTSEDGLSWDAHPFPVNTGLANVDFGGGLYFATGEQGVIFTSEDRIHWTQRAGSSTRNIRSLTGDASNAIAVGEGGLILSSKDGRAWNRLDGVTRDDLRSIAYYGARYVAVGGNSRATVASSTDGNQWEIWNDSQGNPLQAVVSYAGQFLAVGLGGTVVRSSGSAWTTTQLEVPWDFRAVTQLGNQFVAIARTNAYAVHDISTVILTSPDGATWTPRLTNSNSLFDLAAGSGRVLAIGSHGQALLSTDGNIWETVDLGVDEPLQEANYVGGVFLVTGYAGNMFSSSNGRDWVGHDLGPQPYNSPQPTLIWSGSALGRFFVGSGQETIWQSVAFEMARVSQGPGVLYWELSPTTHQALHLQYSLDLQTWVDAGVFAPDDSSRLHLPIPPDEPMRFYRIVDE
jgi:hypothetical protein